MENFYHLDELKARNIKYILSIGKRQPMHVEHKKGLEKILALKNMKLVYIIGSANLKGDPLFDPIVNPLTIKQQKEQFKAVFPDADPLFLSINDDPEMEKWGDIIIAALAEYNIHPSECAIYFIGKEEDKLKQDISFSLAGKKVKLRAGQWLIEALNFWGFPIWFDKDLKVDLNLSARNLRILDLFDKDNMKFFAAGEYLQEQALKARAKNPELGDLAITLYDLSLQRMKEI